MERGAIVRDRLFRKLEPLVGPEEAEYLMSSLPPDGWDEVATKTDLRVLQSELTTDIAVLRSELKTDIAELRSEMREGFAKTVSRDELGELMALHIDARLGASMRSTLMWSVAMNATMLGAVIAAIRL